MPEGEQFGFEGGAMANGWDARTGAARGEALRHLNTVRSAVFSPDGARLVTASDDGTAQVWDASTGAVVGEALRHQGPVRSAVFSPDGSRVVTASDDATAQVWDASTGAAVGKALRHRKPVRTAAFSPDGTRLVTVSDEDAALVWDVLPAPATNAYRLASLAEAVAGVKLDAHGNVHLLDTPATLLHQLREEAAAPADFSHWFLADPFTRSISPLSAVRLEEYIDHRLADEGCDQAEAAFFDAPFLSALVRRRHEQSCPATR